MRHFFLLMMAALLGSCTLQSTTFVPPKQSFELGMNEHGVFRVRVKNLGDSAVTVYRAPIAGGKHSFVTLAHGQSTSVKVESNTALVLQNTTSDTAAVQLHVRGDVNLGMTYQK